MLLDRVCGADPKLVWFAADLEWQTNGVEVERFNLSQQPAAFVAHPDVAAALNGETDTLPILVIDGEIVSRGSYPDRHALTVLAGTPLEQTLCTDALLEMVALGAAVASDCKPCFRFHFDKARKLGVTKEDMARAVAVAAMVKEAPARSVLETARKYLGQKIPSAGAANACCAPAESSDGAAATASECC